MAGYNQEKEIEIGGGTYIARLSLDAAEKVEDAVGMGLLQLLRAAAAPTISTKHISTVLGFTLFRKAVDVDVTVKPQAIGTAAARLLVEKAGYFDGVRATLEVIGMMFKDEAA